MERGTHHARKTKKKMSQSHLGRNKGEDNSNWQGGQFTGYHGYVWVLKPEHPNANYHGYIKRCHLIAEKALGRYLKKGEIVHHINGKRDDDRRENLLVCTRAYHGWLHAIMKSEHKNVDKRIKDGQWLYEKYCANRLCIREIAEICRCSWEVVREKFDEFEIKVRDQREAQQSRLIREGYYEKKNKENPTEA